MVALLNLVDCGDLCLENDLVERTLLGREPAVYRKRPGDIRGVVVQLAAGVDQQ